MKPITPGTPKWYKNLSPSFWVNSVGISNNAGRVVAATFFHDYSKPGSGPNKEGAFGTYCYDANGNQLWRDRFQGMDGVFGVAISGDRKIAAAGGWYNQNQALLRAYDASDGTSLIPAGEPTVIQIQYVSPDGSVVDGPRFTRRETRGPINKATRRPVWRPRLDAGLDPEIRGCGRPTPTCASLPPRFRFPPAKLPNSPAPRQ
jgi:hypothetical protein